MNIDLGWLGKVVLEELETPWIEEDHLGVFEITQDGYTESGIRVHAVLDRHTHRIYPTVWNNAILIKDWMQ